MQTSSIIDNRDVSGPATITSTSPTTGETLAAVCGLDAGGAAQAVGSARAAFAPWAASSVRARQRLLARWLKLLVEEEDTLARLVAQENGKPVAEARLVDITPACEALSYYVRHGHRLLAEQPVEPRQLLFAHWQRPRFRFEPLGVIAIITPWNYPVGIPMAGMAAALLAGNTVVFKPASATVLIGLMLGDLARRAGFPDGVLNTVALPGRATDAIVDDPRVAKILFTGSVGIGRRVAERAATRLCPVQLELGGKDAAVVAADADLERAARGIVWGAFMNTGQSCASIERVYVEREVYEPFVRRVVELTRELRVGDPLSPDTDLGPMTTAEQREVVRRQVEDAVAEGARALTGGAVLEGRGLFYPPTVLVDVREEMEVMQEETFGPVLPIAPVADLAEGIARANASRFGLTASGWTRSHATAQRLQRELDAGVVMINEHGLPVFAEPTAIWGGVRESGIGRAHGHHGMLELVNVKYVAADFSAQSAAPWYYPYDEDFGRFISTAVPALYASGVRKLRALAALSGNRRFRDRVKRSVVVRNVGKLF